MDREDWVERRRATMEEHGVALTAVSSQGGDPSLRFCYTTGLTALGQPELVVVGLPDGVAGHVLNTVHRRVRDDGLALAPGAVVPGVLGGEQGVTLCPVIDRHEVWGPSDFYDSYAVLQAVYPDRAGRYPWDEGCEYADQGDWWFRPAP